MQNLIRVLHHMESKADKTTSKRAASFVRAFQKRRARIHERMQQLQARDNDSDPPADDDDPGRS